MVDLEAAVAASAFINGYRGNTWGDHLGQGPFLTGPQQDTKLVALNDDVKFRVDIAASNLDPLTEPQWTSLSTSVKMFSITHGRNATRDQPGPAQLSVTFENTNGRLDPTGGAYEWIAFSFPRTASNTSGYPGKSGGAAGGAQQRLRLNITKPVRFQAVAGGSTYTLFRGSIDRFDQNYLTPGDTIADVEMEMSCSDNMKLLALERTSSTFAEELLSDRVDALLDDAGWIDSTGWRNIVVSTSTLRKMQAIQPESQNNLDLIRQAVNSDGGVFLLQKDGRAAFHNRTWTTNIGAGLLVTYRVAKIFDVGQVSQIRISPTSTEAGYMDTKLWWSDENLWTQGIVSNVAGTTTIYNSTANQVLHGVKSLQVGDSINVSTQNDVDMITSLIQNHQEPRQSQTVESWPAKSEHTHWYPEFFRLEQDDYVGVDAFVYSSTSNGWIPSARSQHVTQLTHSGDIRTRTWRCGVTFDDPNWP